jgi:hypothetical protein
LIREATAEKDHHLSLAEKAAKGPEDDEPKLFGGLGRYIQLPQDKEKFVHMTLKQVAEMEWAGIEEVLRQALVHSTE